MSVESVSEIINLVNSVVYSLRRNHVWSISNSYVGTRSVASVLHLTGTFRVKEVDFLRNFTVLKWKLLNENAALDDILLPFLDIIKSGITTGTVTLVAIEGISQLLDLEFSLGLDTEILVDAVTRCKFEASDSVNDEIVLSNILKLLQKIILKFQKLRNHEILSMVQVSLGMYFQNRISEFLKREALTTLTTLLRVIFTENDGFSTRNGLKLEILKVISGLLDQENRNNIDSVHRNLGLYLLFVVLEQGGLGLSTLITLGLADNTRIGKDLERKKSFVLKEHVQKVQEVNLKELQVKQIQQVPHLDLILDNPLQNQEENSDLEEVVKIGRMVKELIGNDLCKAAFQLIQAYDLSFNSPPSWPIISLIHQALKALCSLFRTNRVHLKYQMDWFIMWCIKSVDSGLLCWNIEDWMGPIGSENNSQNGKNEVLGLPQKREILIGEIREMILANLHMVLFNNLNNKLILDDTFLLDLYVNYDGDMDMENNLYDNLMRFLAKHSFPDATYGGPVSSLPHQALCLDSILLFLNQVVERSTHKMELDPNLPSNSFLSLNRTRKKILIEGTMLFNENPKKGIPFLQGMS